MKLRERILRWAIQEFLLRDDWQAIIKIFVEAYRKRYYEDNDPTAYFNIDGEVRKNLPHAPK